MGLLQQLLRTKEIEQNESTLERCLTAVDLTLLGIGVIIGAGIFVLTGIAAATTAGPGIILSFVLAALACAFSALCYAELASCIGGCGSAYGYAYVGLGELFAWMIGWDLLLEYGMCASSVAIGWSSYFKDVFASMHIFLPQALSKNPLEGGVVNLPALLIVVLITSLIAFGTSKSAKFNAVIVAVKLTAIAIFIGIASEHVNPIHWHPFLPFGWGGVTGGAAMIFFAYIGFDAVSTAAEEAINPQRDLPIGIIASLVICTILYMIVAALLTGVTSYTTLNVASPVADVMLRLGYHTAAALIGVGALAGLTTVILVMVYGFTRVFLAMARDRLLPPSLAKISPLTRTPLRIIVLVGAIIALFAGFMPINELAALVNIGTLSAFAIVCLGVIMIRKSKPEIARGFKTPGMPWLPIFGIATCLFLMLALPRLTWICFLIWNIVGLFIYFGYSRHHSVLSGK